MSILNEDSIDIGIFETIYEFISHDEYERTHGAARKLLNRLEGHDATFEIWFNGHQVSKDGYEWQMAHDIGLVINLQDVTKVCWQTGAVWSVHDVDDVMSLVIRHLKSQHQFYIDHNDQKITYKFNGFKKITKDQTGRLGYMFEPELHFRD